MKTSARSSSPRWLCAPLAWLASLSLLASCSGTSRDLPGASSEPTRVTTQAPARPAATTPCEDWSTIECGIEIDSHDGVVDCARGVRLCRNGVYGACAADASLGVVAVQAPDVVLPTSAPTRTMALGGSSVDCADDVCNPFCQRFTDEPDEPFEAERVDVPTGDLSGGALQDSNLPNAFKNKGSLDAQCSSAQGSESWNEACQFDQHCVADKCVAWEPGEFGDCQGVDVTTPTSCVPSGGDTRVLTVCNRGTVAAPAGINCFGYPGGSPQFPNSDPGTSDTLLMTTKAALLPGECESQEIDEDIFGQNGIQSVGCNPPQEQVVTATVTSSAGSSSATADLLPWTSPDNGWVTDSLYATSTPANPNGATTGPAFPSASSAFGSDGTWSNPENTFSAASSGSFASATPAAPASGSGSIGPSYPGGFDNPGSTGDLAFSNPDRVYSADAQYLTATPTNPSTIVTVSPSPSANDAGAGWTNHANAYASDSVFATAKLTGSGTSDLQVSGFGINLPTTAILDSVELRVKWKTDVNSNKYTLTAQALTGASDTAVGSALTKSDSYTTESTDSLTIPAASLTGLTASSFSDANFKVRVRFSRSNGNVTDSTASVDSVQVVVNYHLASTTASIVYRYFGLGSIPSNAQVQMVAEVKWKGSAYNANFKLGMQLYKNYGSASQATIGSEVTRTPADGTTVYVDSTPTLTPSPADLIDTSFALRLRAVRSDGSVNPDVTASIDYVRVTLTWALDSSSVTHSLYLSGFGLDQQIPADATITSVSTSAKWNLSNATTASTLGLQAYTAGGTTPLGNEVTDSTAPTTLTTATQALGNGVTRSQLSDANFGVRVRVSRGAVLNAPAFTAQLDDVSVVVTWTAPSVGYGVTYGNFGFDSSVPSAATITGLTTSVRYHDSVSTSRHQLAFQLVKADGTAIGAEFVHTGSPTIDTTVSQALSNLSLAASEIANGQLFVKVRSTRTSGNSNPDFTTYLDSVRIQVTYSENVDYAVAECNGSNNWTATKLSPSPDECQDMSTPQWVPFTVTRVFQGLCGEGQMPTWRRFGYTTVTPGGTSVEFRFRSFSPDAQGACTALTPVTSGTPTPLATASNTQDPQVCLTSDPACVLDLAQNLGGLPDSGLECLQMDAYGIPSGEDSPQLFDWNVLYDCMDAE